MAAYYLKCIIEAADGAIDRLGYGITISRKVGGTKTKPTVITDIESRGLTVKTVYHDDHQGRWIDGDEVHVADGRYLRTDVNDIQADNLEHLPECPESLFS